MSRDVLAMKYSVLQKKKVDVAFNANIDDIHFALLWKFLTLFSSYVEFIVDNRGVPAGNNKAISGMEEILPAY